MLSTSHGTHLSVSTNSESSSDVSTARKRDTYWAEIREGSNGPLLSRHPGWPILVPDEEGIECNSMRAV